MSSTDAVATTPALAYRFVGDKQYELSNHLGNVLSVISDRSLASGSIFMPDVLSFSDYFPFGMLVPTRHGSLGNYRYGFNGKENDNEIFGEGNSIDFGARMLDSRIGRWLTVDPLAEKYPSLSPYCYVANNPINFIDPDGREPKDDIRINTKTNVTEIIRTDDKFDRVFKDGSYVGTTKKGYAENIFKQHGKVLKESSRPQGVGMGAVDGAIMFLAAEAIGAYIGAVKGVGFLKSALSTTTGKVAVNATANITLNATTQYIANGGNAGEINMLEAGFSGIPRIGPGLLGELAPVVAGETFSLTAKNGFQTPNSPAQWGAQVGGGILSFGFGKATDNHLAGEGVGGAVVGGFFKGVVETGSNAAPNLVKE